MAIETVPTRLRALLHTGDILVELEGTIHLARRTRFSDLLSSPDPMQEVHDATVTRHLPTGLQQEIAPLVMVSRDRMLLATEERLTDSDPADTLPGMRVQLDAHRVKLLCPGLDVLGTVHVPQGGSPYYLPSTGAGRFVGITQATATSTAGRPLPMFGGELPFCLVNRSHIQVVIGSGPALPVARGAAAAAQAPG